MNRKNLLPILAIAFSLLSVAMNLSRPASAGSLVANDRAWALATFVKKGGPRVTADATALNIMGTTATGQVPLNIQQRTGAGTDAFKVYANGQYRLRVDSNGQLILNAPVATRFNSNSATLLTSTSVSAGTSSVMVFDTSGGAVALTMCAANAVPIGTMLYLKDGMANAATNNITATRAGSDTFITTATAQNTLVINTNGGGAIVVSDGTSKWYVWRTTG